MAFALARARATQPPLNAWTEALGTGRDITRLSPLRRDTAHVWEAQSALAAGVDRATRNLRVLVRRVLFALGDADPLPPAIAGLLIQLADAVDLMAADVGGDQSHAVRALIELAGLLDPAQLGAASAPASSSVSCGQRWSTCWRAAASPPTAHGPSCPPPTDAPPLLRMVKTGQPADEGGGVA